MNLNNHKNIIDVKLKDNINKIEIIENKYNEIIEYKDLIKNIKKEIEIINKEKEKKSEEYKNDNKIFRNKKINKYKNN